MRCSALLTLLLALTPATPADSRTVPASAAIVGRNSGMCLDVSGASMDAGAQVLQWRCHGGPNQQWDLRPASGGYNLVNRNSGLCADIRDGSDAGGAKLIQWPCSGSANQRFALSTSEDWVELLPSHSGQCLDVDGASLDDGAAVQQWACAKSRNQQWTLSSKGPRSAWSKTIPLSIVPVAAATLRNGKILAWSSYDRLNFGPDLGTTYSTLFDPATNTATERLVSSTGHDMFCPGVSTLPDGRILVSGGISSAKTSIYDPERNSWTSGANMKVPRGYQGNTVLSTGDVLTVGGSWSGGRGGKIAEVWNANSGWRSLPGIALETMFTADREGVYRSDNHMWLFGAANGAVFHAGPSAKMHWLSTAGNGAATAAGTRGDDDNAMNGSVVMFEPGKVLSMGGSADYENDRASESAYVVDFSHGPSVPPTTVKQKPMAFPRAFANAVALPNGQVAVVGGMSYAKVFTDDRSIMVPEIWTPATGSFQQLAPMAVPRNYHSVAALMLDGRVWVGGGGLCGGCGANHSDAEILSPPYLFNADGTAAVRPVIKTALGSVTIGRTVAVTTDRAVSSFALVRLSAATHSVNNDQRRVPLSIASTSGTSYKLTIPADRGTLIPGDWMLFAMTASGTPSLARIVRVL